MSERVTVASYLAGEEVMRRRELAFGVVREPPAPGYGHQLVVGRMYERLARHVRRSKAGRIVVSPVDVVLDREMALIVQPDIVFVSEERLGICRERVWGPPDMVVEVLSSATRRHDRSTKVEWFEQYGIRECWLADPVACTIEVVTFAAKVRHARVFEADEIARSTVLPRLRLRAGDAFSG
jgi:Uma2 family endonuclease